MALVMRPYLLRYWFIDNDGAVSHTDVKIASSLSFDSAIAYSQAFAPSIQAISNCKILRFGIFAEFKETMPSAPAIGVSVDTSGAFLFDTADSSIDAVRVPGFDTSLTLSSGPLAGIAIDTMASDIAAMISAIIAGLAGVQPCDDWSSDITAINTAFVEAIP